MVWNSFPAFFKNKIKNRRILQDFCFPGASPALLTCLTDILGTSNPVPKLFVHKLVFVNFPRSLLEMNGSCACPHHPPLAKQPRCTVAPPSMDQTHVIMDGGCIEPIIPRSSATDAYEIAVAKQTVEACLSKSPCWGCYLSLMGSCVTRKTGC